MIDYQHPNYAFASGYYGELVHGIIDEILSTGQFRIGKMVVNSIVTNNDFLNLLMDGYTPHPCRDYLGWKHPRLAEPKYIGKKDGTEQFINKPKIFTTKDALNIYVHPKDRLLTLLNLADIISIGDNEFKVTEFKVFFSEHQYFLTDLKGQNPQRFVDVYLQFAKYFIPFIKMVKNSANYI